MVPEELDKILEKFCRKIQGLINRGHLSLEYVEEIKYRRHSELHSRILGLLSSVGK